MNYIHKEWLWGCVHKVSELYYWPQYVWRKVIIFWLENGKFEFSRKQYIFLKHSKREFCAEFYYPGSGIDGDNIECDDCDILQCCTYNSWFDPPLNSDFHRTTADVILHTT
jgi:hypothetical protein